MAQNDSTHDVAVTSAASLAPDTKAPPPERTRADPASKPSASERVASEAAPKQIQPDGR